MGQRNQIIAVVALLVLLVGVLAYQFTRKPPGAPSTAAGKAATTAVPAAKGAPAPKATAKPAAKAAPHGKAAGGGKDVVIRRADVNIDELLAGIKEVDFEYERERLSRDPLRPLVGAIANQVTPGEGEAAVAPATVGQILSKSVSAIVWDEFRPMAVVDNEVVERGYEYADGTVVLSIERDRVIFKVGDSPIEVKLKEL